LLISPGEQAINTRPGHEETPRHGRE
jgi:hypothetical protein